IRWTFIRAGRLVSMTGMITLSFPSLESSACPLNLRAPARLLAASRRSRRRFKTNADGSPGFPGCPRWRDRGAGDRARFVDHAGAPRTDWPRLLDERPRIGGKRSRAEHDLG